MIYPRNKKKAGLKFSISAAFWLALLVLIFFDGSRAFLENMVIKMSLLAAPERSAQNLSTQNLISVLELRNLKAENERLKRSLGIKNGKREIPADVVLGGDYLFSDFILINEGLNAGIKTGDAAVTEENVLVGLVKDVGSDWSKIAPTGYLGEKIVLRSPGGVFEAAGQGGGELEAELPAELNLRAGDPLYWGSDPEILAGLVDAVEPQPDGQNKISVLRPFSSSGLSHVLIILSND